MLKPPCIPRINTTWSWHIIFWGIVRFYLLVCFCWGFLCLCSWGTLDSSFCLFLCTVFGFSTSVILAPYNDLGGVPFYFLAENWCYFFFKCLIKFISDTLWAWCFLYGKILIKILFLNRYRIFKVNIGSLWS